MEVRWVGGPEEGDNVQHAGAEGVEAEAEPCGSWGAGVVAAIPAAGAGCCKVKLRGILVGWGVAVAGTIGRSCHRAGR